MASKLTIFSLGDASRLAALVATPAYLDRQRVAKLNPLLESQHCAAHSAVRRRWLRVRHVRHAHADTATAFYRAMAARLAD